MSELVRFPLEGGTVLVEVNDDQPGLARASRRGSIAEAQVSFEAGLASVKLAAASALREFKAMASQPDEITIEFGVRLNAEAGAVIAKTGIEGHLQVTLHWRQPPAENADAATGGAAGRAECSDPPKPTADQPDNPAGPHEN